MTVIESFFVLNEKKTPENRKKERLIEKLFLPVGLKCRKTWEYHFGIMDVDETMNIILKIWYYLHGYATLVCTEFIKNPTDEEIKNKILEVATIFISDALDKKLTAIY